jgi:hypothetical protein
MIAATNNTIGAVTCEANPAAVSTDFGLIITQSIAKPVIADTVLAIAPSLFQFILEGIRKSSFLLGGLREELWPEKRGAT